MEIRIIESVVAIAIYIALRFAVSKSIDQTVERQIMQKTRGKIIKKAFKFLLLLVLLVFAMIVWGVRQSDLIVFISSVLAVVGIALFAQWSVLSNITSGILIFFNHPVKLDDTISIIDKDFQIEGRVSDIGLFFIILKTNEGEQVTVPNSVFIQKMIKKKTDQ